jgi:hypothetical protein
MARLLLKPPQGLYRFLTLCRQGTWAEQATLAAQTSAGLVGAAYDRLS